MATVTLLQATDMGGFPSSLPAGGGWFSTEIYKSGDVNLVCTGTFVNVGSFVYPAGTITRAFIDTADTGTFPNIDISGLSFTFTSGYYASNIYSFDPAQLVADMLAGNDTLTGSSGNDTIVGFAGNDTMVGGGGDNLFNGGDGSDTVSYAGAGTGLFAGLEDAYANTGEAAGDTYANVENLIGSAFDDVFYGTDENNRFTGGNGNDQLVGKGGADTFDGGNGTDTVFYDASDPGVRADLLAPGTNTEDAIGDVYILIENLEGSAFDDILLGNNNANVIRGNHYPGLSGADQLFGRGGNDTLFGNDQDDTLVGGTGRDIMTGGAGLDDFDFNSVAEIGINSTRDVIKDFVHLSDDIDLSTIDANGAGAGNTAFSFLAAKGAAFTGTPGQLRWLWSDLAGTANDKTFVAGDINGDGTADFAIELTGLKTLTAADFFL